METAAKAKRDNAVDEYKTAAARNAPSEVIEHLFSKKQKNCSRFRFNM
jgi:hypothetical protein